MNFTIKPLPNFKIALLSFFTVIGIYSCNEDPGMLGGNLIPQGDIDNVKDTVLYANTYIYIDNEANNLKTGQTKVWIGEINTSSHGVSNYLFGSQMYPQAVADTFSFGDEPMIDSVVLYLDIEKLLAVDTVTAAHNLKVFEIDPSLWYMDNISLRKDESVNPYLKYEILGEKKVNYFAFRDSVKAEDTTLAFNGIHMLLNSDYFKRLIEVDDLYLYTEETGFEFQNYFGGIQVTCEDVSVAGPSLSQIKLGTGTNIAIYYTNAKKRAENEALEDKSEATNYSMKLYTSDKNRNYIQVERDYSVVDRSANSSLYDLVTSDVSKADTFFIETMGGTSSSLKLEGLKKLRSEITQSNDVLVLKASIEIPYDTTRLDSYVSKIAQLELYGKDGDERKALTYMITDPQKTFFDGRVTEKAIGGENLAVIQLNLADYFQQYMDGKVNYDEFYIVPSSEKTDLQVLKMFNADKPIKFEFVYSKLN
jgi:hypothetical protein